MEFKFTHWYMWLCAVGVAILIIVIARRNTFSYFCRYGMARSNAECTYIMGSVDSALSV